MVDTAVESTTPLGLIEKSTYFMELDLPTFDIVFADCIKWHFSISFFVDCLID